MSHSKLGRREFIFQSLKTFAAAGITGGLAESMMAHIFNQAFAQGLTEKCYIFFSFPGGPPRWLLDLPTNPSGQSADFMAGGFGNHLQGGAGVARSIQRSFAYSSSNGVIHLPPVWNMGRSGSAYTSLLPNTLMVRGIDMQIDNHPVSRIRNFAPVVGGLSLHGALADQSKLSFPGIGDGRQTSQAFRSNGRLAITNASLGAANPLEGMLVAFKKPTNGTNLTTADWQKAIDQSLEEFDVYAKNIGLRPNTLNDAYERSIEVVKSDTYSLATNWSAVYDKYVAAVDEAFDMDRIKQIFPQALRADGSETFRRPQGAGSLMISTPDLRNMFVAGAGVPLMAKAFAMAELVISKNLSSNVNFELPHPTGYKLNGTDFEIIHDQHMVGSALSTLSTTAFYRGFLNCMTDLTKALKQSGHFSRSVIQVGAEFNRSPRSDQSGSDHGVVGSSSMIVSGMIPSFGLIGNIQKEGLPGTAYTGSWGRAAAFPVGPGTNPILIQDVALTVGRLLGVSPVSQNGYVLLNANGTPVTRQARNV